jgi:hypothetical protein
MINNKIINFNKIYDNKIKYNTLFGNNYNINNLYIFTNTFNKIISFGNFCYISNLLKKLNYKKESYPFDWILSSDEIILDCLSNNFSIFLNPAYYIDNKEYPIDSDTAGHSLYNPIMFVHHNPRIPKTYDYFNRCVNRFNQIKNEDNNLFINIQLYTGEFGKFNYMYLYDYFLKYKQYMDKLKLLYIILSVKDKQYYDVILDIQLSDNSSITIIHIYTLSKCTGIEHENKQDDIFIQNIFSKLKIISSNSGTIINEVSQIAYPMIAKGSFTETHSADAPFGITSYTTSSYEQKYLKYKQKYLKLKNIKVK